MWISNGDRMEWTESGNPRPPSMDVYLEWIKQAWDSIPKEAIVKSFKGGEVGRRGWLVKECH